jgi:alpha-glucosidase
MPGRSKSSDFLWWRDGVIYQIYPRSFADSDGDGIGDLQGIIDHLDYLNDGWANPEAGDPAGLPAGELPGSLGVDAIWLSPVYPSPMHDFGYDVSNYHDIHPDFGALEDFDRLVEEAHKRGIRIVMDWVMNHTSHEHPWFVESRSSRDNARREWYIWRDGRKGRPPNNWQSVFGGPAWAWDHRSGQYYLHLFLPEQPDLNWRNPEVKAAMFDELRFWLDRGVDGFRLDVADAYYKDAQLRDNPSRLGLRAYDRLDHIHDWNQPETHVLLKELRQLLDRYPERMAVAEVGDTHALEYYGEGNDELHLVFNFALLHCRWDPRAFQQVVQRWEDALPSDAWPCHVLSNHDVTRHYSRYSAGRWSDARAKVAAAMLLTMRGTPFLYYGEEIGMRQARIPKAEIQDPPGKRYWPLYKGRDGCRTPMQWSTGLNAGFGAGRPWLRLGPEHQRVNVAAESEDPNSLLNFYRRLIWLRKATPALRRGSYRSLLRKPVGQMAYLRETPDQVVLVCLNLFSRPATVALDQDLMPAKRWRPILSSLSRESATVTGCQVDLAPYEACLFEGE